MRADRPVKGNAMELSSRKFFALIAALLATSCAMNDEHAVSNALQVQTKQGIVVGAEADGIRTFKGIPYAAPPVGALRWKPPAAPLKWNGMRDATQFGPACPTFDTTKYAQAKRLSALGYDIFTGVPLAPGSTEDCLTLDVWAPKNAKNTEEPTRDSLATRPLSPVSARDSLATRPLSPVMVWLNPLGASSAPMWDGTAFARDGVILVSINYRQLSLGNFSHPALRADAKHDEPLGRFQTMDQLAALKWVKENIRAFGGDDRNVTLFGVSAGGASTLQILTIPEAKQLVDKAIVQSGNGWFSPMRQAEMEAIGRWMTQQAGWPADATAEQLRSLPLDTLPHLGAYSIDGRLQKENATDAFAAGRVIDVPMIIGWTDFDGSSLRYPPQTVIDRARDEVRTAYASEGKTGSDLGYQLYTDSHNGAPARWTAKMTATGKPTYLYLWSYVRSADRGKVRGAAHASEATYVFDSWAKAYPQVQLTEEDKSATRMIHSCWISFAKTGKPQCEGAPRWPRYSPEQDQLIDLGLMPRIVTGYRKAQLDAQENAMQDVIDQTRKSIEDFVSGLAKER
jgi:para-nitrobenzyl esterase